MDLHQILNYFLHLNKNLAEFNTQHGLWTYALLFLIIFCETGLVVTPFLPGDSLFFAAGAIAAGGSLNIFAVCLLMTGAALLGDNANYWIGRSFGKPVSKLVKAKHIDETHKFYEKHGVLTLVIAQFVPIIRTFAPFVAGLGKMTYSKFVTFNLIGVLCWSTLFLWSGYFFGNLDVVKENFHYVVLGIIAVSVTPILYQVGKMFFASKTSSTPAKKKKKK